MDILTTAHKQRAFVTFLAGCGDYIQGVIGLVKSLRKVRSVYPLVVAVVDDVPHEHREILRAHECIVRQIDPVRPDGCDKCIFAMPYYVINYSKLRIWTVSILYFGFLEFSFSFSFLLKMFHLYKCI